MNHIIFRLVCWEVAGCHIIHQSCLGVLDLSDVYSGAYLTGQYCIVLYCIVLHCIALHCIALHCIVLYCNVVMFGGAGFVGCLLWCIPYRYLCQLYTGVSSCSGLSVLVPRPCKFLNLIQRFWAYQYRHRKLHNCSYNPIKLATYRCVRIISDIISLVMFECA